MEPEAILFGFACLGTVAFATRSGSISAVLLAWAMVSVWASANMLWLVDMTKWLPLIDLPVASLAFTAWYATRQKWQSVFLGIYAARLILHLIYPGSGESGEVAYFHVLNMTFLSALVAISWKGGADAIGDCMRWVRRLRLLLAGDSALVRAEIDHVGE